MVFGQPPRSLLVPDATFKGKINEEDLNEPEREHIDYEGPEKMAITIEKIITITAEKRRTITT